MYSAKSEERGYAVVAMLHRKDTCGRGGGEYDLGVVGRGKRRKGVDEGTAREGVGVLRGGGGCGGGFGRWKGVMREWGVEIKGRRVDGRGGRCSEARAYMRREQA